MDSPEEAVRLACAGADSGWAGFFAHFDPVIRRVVAWAKWRFSPEVQEDVAQTVRLELHRCLPHSAPPRNPQAFVTRVAARRCIDEVRRQVRARDVPLIRFGEDGDELPLPIAAGEGFDPIAAVAAHERARQARELVARLEATCQDALDRYYLKEQSYRDIAGALGLSVNTVGARLSKCLDRLRALLAADPALREALE